MCDRVKKFQEEREKLNDLILSKDDLNIKRFFALDSSVYRAGALDELTKELAGLSASLVLRCDDCIAYHTIRVKELGISTEQFNEIMSVGLIVGGSITIPHIRRAYRLWEEMATKSQ